MARHWAINGRFLSQPTTGVQRYAREIVRSLDALIAERAPLTCGLKLRLHCPPGSSEIPLNSIERCEIGSTGGHLWEQTQLAASLHGAGLLSLCNTGPILCRKHIICIHDTNVWNSPQSYSPFFRTYYKSLLPLLGKSSYNISTVSNFSLGELIRRSIVPKQKTFVSPNGHEHVLQWKPEHSAATRLAASRDTIVMIGSAAPHKNVDVILGLADRLAKAGLQIAVVGMSGSHIFKTARARTEAPNIHWLGRISDDELAALLMDSLCLAFPSLTEGFGLPVVEAMALGCPVVVSERASLPEVCEDAALYAAADNPQAWFDRFMGLRNSKVLRQQLAAKGKARASAYSWRASALRYVQAMAVADGIDTETKVVGLRELT